MTNNITIFSITLLLSTILYGQGNEILDYNNVSAQVSTTGIFFHDHGEGSAHYTAPKNQNASMFYSCSFWFAGLDPNGQLHMAAQRFQPNTAFFNGPVATNYSEADYISTYENKIWAVSKNEIQNHVENYMQDGYIVPTAILEWPANGNTTNGEAEHLAPFIDYNNNNVYDPENGDYPLIRGDKAVYLIMNDDGPHSDTDTGGNPLQMEFHFMFYQFVSNNYLNNTTFLNLRVINRSNITYNNFKTAFYIDPDIGGAQDDYVGCSPENDLMFAYNGDNDDNAGGGNYYGTNPPALGIKFLSHDLDIFVRYNNAGGLQGDPSTSAEHWGFMNAMHGTSGVPLTQGGNGTTGTVPTNHLFPDNPNDNTGWSEVTEGNSPEDRRMLGVANPLTFSPNQSICYDYAILYNRSGNNNLENVNGLYSMADQVQSFFNAQTNNSCQSVNLGLKTNSSLTNFSIIPNPSNGQFKINHGKEPFDLTILSISGKVLMVQKNINSNTMIESNLESGIYIAQISGNGNIYNQKFYIE